MKLIKSLAAVSVLALLLLGAASPVSAHDGAGAFAVESNESTEQGGVRFVVRLTYLDDDHPANDATVTATTMAEDGTTATPVPMTSVDDDGRYEVTLPPPGTGTWTVRFTSVSPGANLEQPVAADPEEPTESTAPSTTEPGSTTETTEQATDTTVVPAAPAAPIDDGDDGVPLGIAVAAIAVVAVLAGAGAFVLRQRDDGPEATDGD